MDKKQEALLAHEKWRGKLEIKVKCPISTKEDLAVAYTPGVAEPCLAIRDDVDNSYKYTGRGNTVAVITDGTAVLGLGDIGPEAGMPVMEGKCALFREFGGIDAIPLCLRTKDTDEIVRAVELLAGSFGGINLEDISAPRCFEIERRLKASCDIPVFHDDQHGTAIVVLAALINGCRLAGKTLEGCKIVVNGAGAAALAVSKLILSQGAKNLTICDLDGAIYEGRGGLNSEQAVMSAVTNRVKQAGKLSQIIVGADIFIGLSGPNCLTSEDVSKMAKDAIVCAMANPMPEIMPEQALLGGARIACTGRSDYPNQINNVLAFPGVFRGALDARASCINEEMKLAAARAIAELVTEQELCDSYIIPASLDRRAHKAVAKAVYKAAFQTGVARVGEINENIY